MKINIIVGGRFHAGQLAANLSSFGCDVKIYSSSPRRYYDKSLRNSVVFIPKPHQIVQKIFKLRLNRNWSYLGAVIFDIAVLCVQRDADVIWAFNGDAKLSIMKARNKNKYVVLDRACPHIEQQQNLLDAEAKKLNYPYKRLKKIHTSRMIAEYRLATEIVVPSIYSARSFSSYEYASKVTVMPLSGNILGRTQSLSFANLPSQDKQFRIGIVGSSFLRKGLYYVVEGAKNCDFELSLKLRMSNNSFRNSPKTLEMLENVNHEYIGYLDDMKDFYDNIDVFVLASVDEGFGMVLFEAMSFGVPLIATSNVGAIDSLRAGIDYIEIRPGCSSELTDALTMLYNDNAKLMELSRQSIRRSLELSKEGNQYRNALKEWYDKLT